MKIKFAIAVALTGLATAANAQVTPPAPTSPPQTKEPGGQTIVLNPTQAECATGWNANLKWSKEQFDQFCSTLSKSK